MINLTQNETRLDRVAPQVPSTENFTALFSMKIEGLEREIFEGAPCDWSRDRGATHTLWCGFKLGAGTRPAIMLKTVLYVGIDEAENGDIVWQKWTKGKILWEQRDRATLDSWETVENNNRNYYVK